MGCVITVFLFQLVLAVLTASGGRRSSAPANHFISHVDAYWKGPYTGEHYQEHNMLMS